MRNQLCVLGLGAALAAGAAAAQPQELLYVSEGNRLHRFDVDSIGGSGPLLGEVVFENADDDAAEGRDINGMICAIPGGGGLFVAGEDTGQPHPPAGWGVLSPGGRQVGKLTATAFYEKPDPYGCAFDSEGRLFTTETGRQFFGVGNGQLLVWFPPFDRFPGPADAYPETDATSTNYCKLAVDLGTATGVAVDAEGRVYVAASSGLEVVRFSPPFPNGADRAGGCGRRDSLGSPAADRIQRERFLGARPLDGLLTYSGLALAPNGNLYVASVATGRIAEFDLDGELVRMLLEPPEALPPFSTGYPQGLAVDARGTLYYADLDLVLDGFAVDAGADGKVWRIAFDAEGAPQPPELVVRGLAFPDGLGVLGGDLEERAQREDLARRTAEPDAAPVPAAGGGGLPLFLGLLAVIAIAVLVRRRMQARERPF
jgi:sugar lactone lactonase YvrE